MLNNKYRALVYIQSSGGNIPLILDPIIDKGENYISSIMKTMKTSEVQELKVYNTGKTGGERQAAINKAEDEIKWILSRLQF